MAQAVLGHTSIITTVDVYGHLNATWLKQQMDMMHMSGNFYGETARLSERISQISPEEIIKSEPQKIMKILVDAKKLAKITVQLCHQLTPNNKKGLT